MGDSSRAEAPRFPPGLPRANPVRSYWWEPISDIADHRTTADLPSSADVVIVGAGISGASIAYNLLTERPDAKIVLLEARQAASGASGRNGGHTKPAVYHTFIDNVAKVGEEDAIKIGRLEYNCMLAVHEFIAKHGIAADAVRSDSVDIFYDEAEWARAKESVALVRKLIGHADPAVAEYEVFDGAEAASKYLCVNALGGVRHAAGSLNGYKLTIGILKLALAKGLNLQCNTPAVSIAQTVATKTAQEWTVSTERGSITTPTLILTTNGYTAHLLPEFASVLRPFRGVVTAQRPGLGLPQHGLPTTYSMVYERNAYEYMITRQAGLDFSGDLVIGGGRHHGGPGELGTTDDTVVPADIVAYLLDSTRNKYFGSGNWGSDNAAGRLRMAWSGIMSGSADEYPFVGPVPGKPGLFVSVSFQGHGMVLCWLCARACADMVLGRQDQGLDDWFPNTYRVTAERMSKTFQK